MTHRALAASLTSTAILLLPATPTAAEVCDKVVGETWRPEHGVVWLLNPVGFPYWLTLLIGLAAVVAIAKLRFVGFILAAAMAAMVTLMTLGGEPDDVVYQFAVKEGCLSKAGEWSNVALLTGFAWLYLWLGYRARRFA